MFSVYNTVVLEGLSLTTSWKTKADELRNSKPVKQALRQEQADQRKMQAMYAEFGHLLDAVDDGQEGMAPAKNWVVKQSAIAAAKDDSADRQMVRRVLSGLSASIFEGRQELERAKKYGELTRRLQLATEFPNVRPNIYVELAAAQLRMGNKKGAFEALDRAAAKGVLEAAMLERNAALVPLNSDQRYSELLKKLAK